MKVPLLRFGRYFSVAALSAGGDWILFSILLSVLGTSHLFALGAARIFGGLISFVSNRRWTFATTKTIKLGQQGRRFLLLYAFSYVLSLSLFSLQVDVFEWHAYPAKLTTDIICFIVNFLAMDAYVFHRRDGLVALLRSQVPFNASKTVEETVALHSDRGIP